MSSRSDWIGAQAEARFFNACDTYTAATPDWFLSIGEAGIAWDLRGVDAFAYVVPVCGGRRLKVPIQIKSSESGRREFIETFHSDVVLHTMVIVVSEDKTNDELRAEVYEKLAAVRDKGERFDDFLARTMKRPLSEYAKKVLGRLAHQIRQLRRVLEG